MAAAAAIALVPLIFFGDSLADGLASAFPAAKTQITRVGWGLWGHGGLEGRALMLARAVADHPDRVVVVELGTNDLEAANYSANWQENYEQRVSLVARSAAAAEHVLWLSPPTFCGPAAWRNGRAEVLNLTVRRALRNYRNVEWVDTRPMTGCGPERATDGVHFRDLDGYRTWLARLMTRPLPR